MEKILKVTLNLFSIKIDNHIKVFTELMYHKTLRKEN